MTRKVELTDPAIDDLAWQKITRGEFVQLLAMLKEVAALPNPAAHYAVTAIKCTDNSWYRAKHRPTNVRVVFEFSEDALTVHCILRRCDNTYSWVDIWYQAQGAAA